MIIDKTRSRCKTTPCIWYCLYCTVSSTKNYDLMMA